LDWRHIDIEFGRHSAGIGQDIQARYKGQIYRAMLGARQRLSSWATAQIGYRYNDYRLDDVCGADGDQQFHTLGGGFAIQLLAERLSLEENMEYSWLADGDFKNVISARYAF